MAQDASRFVVGIDLGTTNSLVAIVEDGVPRIIPDREGHKLTPSAIYFEEDGEVVVGHAARQKMALKPERGVFSVKRFMGKGAEDLRDEPVGDACRLQQ